MVESDAPGRAGSAAARRERAAHTFSRFVPDVDIDRLTRSMERRYGALGTFAFETVGEMWDRTQLSRRDRSLMIIATLSAQARDEELVLHTEIGLRHGLTRIEIEEILPMVAAYAGFPAAMAASRAVDQGLRAAEQVERLSARERAERKDDAQRDSDGAEVRGRMTNVADLSAADALNAMTDRMGDLGELAHRWAFGEIWSRPQLSRRDRSIVVIAILVWLGAEAPLTFHARAGRNHGLERTEIEEIINHLGLYCGLPRAITAMAIARAALDKHDESAD